MIRPKHSILIGSLLLSLAGLHAHAQKPSTSVMPKPRPVQTEEEMKAHIGLRAGGANPGANYDNAFEYGLEYGLQPYIPFGMAFELSGYQSSGASVDPSLNRAKLMLKGNYNFGGQIPVVRESYVGAGLGPVMDTLGGTSYGRLGLSLQGGFDVPLTASGSLHSGDYSLGADLRYLFVSNNAPDDFNFSGVVKYWF